MPLCHHKKEVIRSSTWSSMIAKVRRSHLCSSEMFLLPTGCTREALPRARFSRSNALVGCPSAHPPVAWTGSLAWARSTTGPKQAAALRQHVHRAVVPARQGKTVFHHGASISTQIFRSSEITGEHSLCCAMFQSYDGVAFTHGESSYNSPET